MAKHVPRVFSDHPLATGRAAKLRGETAHHLLHVLRLKPGAELILFDGRGGEYPAKVAGTGRDWVDADLFGRRDVNAESGLAITLAQGVSRGERMDYTLRKAVELGVRSIIPLETERSVARPGGDREEKKMRHWQAIARSAAEQSGRDRIPDVSALLPLETWLGGLKTEATKLVLNPAAATGLRSITRPEAVVLLVGPEGGLSEPELQAAQRAGFTDVRLGPRILRTETAGVSAIAAMQALWGDLGG